MKFITFLYMSINVYYNSPGPRAAQAGNSFIQIHIFIVCYISFLFFFFLHRFISRFFFCLFQDVLQEQAEKKAIVWEDI